MAKKDTKSDKEGKRSRSNYVVDVERRARIESQSQLRSLGPSQQPHSLVRNKLCHYCKTVVPFAISFNCPIEGHVFCEEHLCLTIAQDDISVSTKRYQATVPSSLNYCPICSLQCQCSICNKNMNKAATELRLREAAQKKKLTSVDMKVLPYLYKPYRIGNKNSPSPVSPTTAVRPGRRRRNSTTTNDDENDNDDNNNNNNSSLAKKRTRKSNNNNSTNDSSSDDDNNNSSLAANRRTKKRGNNNSINNSSSNADDDNNEKSSSSSSEKKNDNNNNPNNNTNNNTNTLPSKLTYPQFVRSHLELFFMFMPGRDGSEVFRRLNDAWRHHVDVFGDNCGDSCGCLQQDGRNEILKFLVSP